MLRDDEDAGRGILLALPPLRSRPELAGAEATETTLVSLEALVLCPLELDFDAPSAFCFFGILVALLLDFGFATGAGAGSGSRMGENFKAIGANSGICSCSSFSCSSSECMTLFERIARILAGGVGFFGAIPEPDGIGDDGILLALLNAEGLVGWGCSMQLATPDSGDVRKRTP